jgi:hypothetical protein
MPTPKDRYKGLYLTPRQWRLLLACVKNTKATRPAIQAELDELRSRIEWRMTAPKRAAFPSDQTAIKQAYRQRLKDLGVNTMREYRERQMADGR